MREHVCPWWGGYFIDNRLRRLLHNPEKTLAPYVHTGMTVMDFGCGMGFFSIAMAKLVGDSGRVIAVDSQQKMLNVLKKRSERAGVASRIRTHRCERDSLGVEDPVDFVLAFWSAHEVPDMRRFLTDSHRCLVTGSTMLVVEPRGHVSEEDFEAMTSTARELGLRPGQKPRVRFSHAMTFVKE